MRFRRSLTSFSSGRLLTPERPALLRRYPIKPFFCVSPMSLDFGYFLKINSLNHPLTLISPTRGEFPLPWRERAGVREKMPKSSVNIILQYNEELEIIWINIMLQYK